MHRPACDEHPLIVWSCRPCVAAYRRYRRACGKDRSVRVGDRVTTERSVRYGSIDYVHVALGRFDVGVIDRRRTPPKGAHMAQAQDLHFEKGQAFIGRDTSIPVDMSQPEFAGLEDVVSRQKITSGDYRWNADSGTLTPAVGGGEKLS